MKKTLLMTLMAAMMLTMAGCGSKTEAPKETQAETEAAVTEAATDAAETEAAAPAGPATAEEVRGVTIPKFEITVNGIAITNEEMAAYPVYSVEATSTNSKGTVSTSVYQGFALKDICDAAGLTENYVWVSAEATDGYSITWTKDVMEPTTMVAVTKDGSQFKEAPWFAPCTTETTGDYVKGCIKLLVNTTEGAPEIAEPEKTTEGAKEDTPEVGAAPEVKDVTEKVTFADYSFKLNGEDVTNAQLEGLSIYKITVVTQNSKGDVFEDTYCGYVLADVLNALGIEATTVKAIASDGYESELAAGQVASDLTLVAIEKNKETGADGTIWLAPCEETFGKAYARDVIELQAN